MHLKGPLGWPGFGSFLRDRHDLFMVAFWGTYMLMFVLAQYYKAPESRQGLVSC